MYLLYMVGFICIFKDSLITIQMGKCSHMLTVMVLHNLFIYVHIFKLQFFIVSIITVSSVKSLLVNY